VLFSRSAVRALRLSQQTWLRQSVQVRHDE
jgi:hypothetical protein